MKEEWHSATADAFSTNRTIMKMVGTWPVEKRSLWYNVKWILLLLFQAHLITSMLLELYLNCDDVSVRIEIFVALDGGIRSIASNILLRVRATNLATNIAEANNDWVNYGGDSVSSGIMRRYMKIGRRVSLAQIATMIVINLTYSTMTIVLSNASLDLGNNTETTRIFVQPGSCLHSEVNDLQYVIICIIEFFECAIVIVNITVMNAIFSNAGMHLCGQLFLLNRQFEEYCEGNEQRKRKIPIGDLVQRHCKLVQFAKSLNDTVSLYLFLQFLMSSVLLAVGGFRLISSLKRQHSKDVYKSSLIVMYVLTTPLFTAYVCDSLTAVSEDTYTSISNASWHNHSVGASKELIFLMMRMSSPIRINAENFFSISRLTVINILKTAFSYISFLQVAIKDS